MGPQDPSNGLTTPATTPIPPRVLPGRKRSESGASSVKLVMMAATASALRTRTDNFASTGSSAKPCLVEQEQPKLSPALSQVQQRCQVHVGLYVENLRYMFERRVDAQKICRRCRRYG
jgi:hypothetical protein